MNRSDDQYLNFPKFNRHRIEIAASSPYFIRNADQLCWTKRIHFGPAAGGSVRCHSATLSSQCHRASSIICNQIASPPMTPWWNWPKREDQRTNPLWPQFSCSLSPTLSIEHLYSSLFGSSSSLFLCLHHFTSISIRPKHFNQIFLSVESTLFRWFILLKSFFQKKNSMTSVKEWWKTTINVSNLV